MSFDYDRAQATAARLIDRFGQDVVVRTPGPTTGPPHNPTPGTPSDETVKGVKLGFSLFYRAQGFVQQDDIMLLIEAPIGGAPQTDESILIDGVEHQIVRSEPFEPSDVLVYVELVIRK